MKLKKIIILFLSLIVISCGNKSSLGAPQFETSRPLTDTKTITKDEIVGEVSEHSCIDDKLNKDLESGESIRHLVINSDFMFCNGVRLRLKSYQFTSKKYKAYGFVQSNSGKDSCLIESEDFTHIALLGDQGVLNGDDMKILIGGHSFNSDNKIQLSNHVLARNVKFSWDTYRGELAILEKGKVKCWAIQ